MRTLEPRETEEWVFPTVIGIEFECRCKIEETPSLHHIAYLSGGYVRERDEIDGVNKILMEVLEVTVAATGQKCDIWPDGLEQEIQRELEAQ